jgi:hypothetical protein
VHEGARKEQQIDGQEDELQDQVPGKQRGAEGDIAPCQAGKDKIPVSARCNHQHEEPHPEVRCLAQEECA